MGDTTIERPGHFIASESCEFGRTTICDHVFVSSVGEYRSPRGRIETIGFDRLYETMVFRWSGQRCTNPECKCGGLPEPISWESIEMRPANTRDECIANHNALVAEWMHKEPTDA